MDELAAGAAILGPQKHVDAAAGSYEAPFHERLLKSYAQFETGNGSLPHSAENGNAVSVQHFMDAAEKLMQQIVLLSIEAQCLTENRSDRFTDSLKVGDV